MDPEQLVIPTQAIHHSPGGPFFPGQPYPAPSAQAPAPQYLTSPAETPQYHPYLQYQQHYADSGHGYLSGAATAPGYSTADRRPQAGHPGRETTSPRDNGVGHQVPWRGEKAAALVLMLIACALEFIIYITFILTLNTGGGWLNIAILTLMFIAATPAVWSHYFGLRHLFHNQPVSEMVGLSLWFGLGSLTLTSGTQSGTYDELQGLVVALLFIVGTISSILTIRLNQRLRNPRPWTVTLALGSCQFILLNSAFRLSELAFIAYTRLPRGQSLSHYTASTWLIWSEGEGMPLAPGLAISAVITSLATVGLFLGKRSPHSRGFMITSVSAAILLTLHNLLVFVAYGLPSSGGRSYKPSDSPIELLAIIIVGAVLIGSTWLAGRRPAAAPPAGNSPYSRNTSRVSVGQGVQSRLHQHQRPHPPAGGGY
ncbi:annexin A7 [Actinomyces viscosus]|nr:annexin A7 [Actinomyces viscosus]